MTELYWPRDSTFTDSQADLRFTGEGVYEVPDRLEDFYRTRGWEDPPEDFDGEVQTAENAVDRNQSGPTRDELVPDDGDEGGSGN